MTGRGKGIGTGSPISFKCPNCISFKHGQRRTYANQVTLTGRVRKRPRGRGVAGPRHRGPLYEYVCNVCGHRGWSSHSDLDRVARRGEHQS